MAGAGKTTLVAAWLQRTGRPATWLSLDRDDNDPLCFAMYLIAALQRVDSAIGQAAQSILEAQHLPPAEALMAPLINDIAETAAPFILALDDFHVIRTPAIHAMIGFLLEHQPPQLHLVLLTREDPPLPLPRLRVRDQLTELRADDLRFTADEIARFLQQTNGLALGADLIAALEARTEGWIAGVQLAALALQQRSDVGEYIRAFSGSQRYVIDYLATDVLQRLPNNLRTFLRQTAILNRLTAPLCDAVTGRTDGAASIQQLEHANLFVTPLDGRREWYRYHHLFAEFLRSAVGTDEQPMLHRRAAQWYHANGFVEDAVGHALASNDEELAARLIGEIASQAIQKGQLTTLLGWLAAMPDACVRANSDLAIAKGWGLWLTGQADAAESYARSAEVCLTPDAPPVRRGRLLGLRIFLEDPDASGLRRLWEALELLGDADPLFRSLILLRLAYTQLMYDNATEAICILRALVDLEQQSDGQLALAIALGRLALALHIHGQRREALAVCQSAIDRFVDARGQPLPIAAGAYIVAGRLAYAADDLPRAAQQLTTGLDLAQRLGLATAIVEGKEALARLQLALGQPIAGLTTLAEARALATRMQVRAFVDYLAAVEAEYQMKSGNRAAAERWAEPFRQAWATQDPAGGKQALLYGPYVQLLLAQHCPREALALLAGVERWERTNERYSRLVPIYILQALAHHDLGDMRQALACLEQAVGLAAPEEERRAFLDAGPHVMDMLPGVRYAAPIFVDDLLAAFRREDNQAAPARSSAHAAPVEAVRAEDTQLLEPLSQREDEILQLIAVGMSNQAVANALVIAPGTVKKHLDNIYGKLGAHNRTEAVARARRLELLPE
jgi:LuxR family maltose regulon positive regulatory protein